LYRTPGHTYRRRTTDLEGCDVAISWRRDDRAATVVATSRWNEAVETVTERFQRFNELPLEEAVEAALVRTPGNMTRDELTRRIAATRERDLSQR
jgi:hypothetical protein